MNINMAVIKRFFQKFPRSFAFDESTVQTFNFGISRPDVRQCLVVKHPWLTCQKIKPNHINDPRSFQIEVRSVVSSSMHPWPENLVVIGRAVVYYARLAHIFSAEIKCRLYSLSIERVNTPRLSNYQMSRQVQSNERTSISLQ